jgi:hypothetical protein
MSRGYNYPTKPWSKLQKQLYSLIASDIALQIHCTVYSFSMKFDTFESPRHWITLGKEIVWDFPSHFLQWNHPDVPKPIEYMEQEYWRGRSSSISQLFRQYLDTPREEILSRHFPHDYWGLINILRAADRRIGRRRLQAFKNTLRESEPAVKVLAHRLERV